MFSVKASALPPDALLKKYDGDLHYTDCYCAELAGAVSQAQFVTAFYSTWVFKLERAILRWVASKPSTSVELRQLVAGEVDQFSAWIVEARGDNQLLLSDFRGRTRSWLMTSTCAAGGCEKTRLHFGSAVIASKDAATGKVSIGLLFHALLGFHKLYSRILLHAARARLKRLAAAA